MSLEDNNVQRWLHVMIFFEPKICTLVGQYAPFTVNLKELSFPNVKSDKLGTAQVIAAC